MQWYNNPDNLAKLKQYKKADSRVAQRAFKKKKKNQKNSAEALGALKLYRRMTNVSWPCLDAKG